MTLPCLDCGGLCCLRGAYGTTHAAAVLPHEDVPYRHLLVNVAENGEGWLPFDSDGACIMRAADGKCSVHDTHKPEHCRRGSCVADGIVGRLPERVQLLIRGIAA